MVQGTLSMLRLGPITHPSYLPQLMMTAESPFSSRCSGYRNTDNMTAKELKAEEVRLSQLASSGQITPKQAARLREVKEALREIHSAQRMW